MNKLGQHAALINCMGIVTHHGHNQHEDCMHVGMHLHISVYEYPCKSEEMLSTVVWHSGLGIKMDNRYLFSESQSNASE